MESQSTVSEKSPNDLIDSIILMAIAGGAKNVYDLNRQTGYSERFLAARLQRLIERGAISKT